MKLTVTVTANETVHRLTYYNYYAYKNQKQSCNSTEVSKSIIYYSRSVQTSK